MVIDIYTCWQGWWAVCGTLLDNFKRHNTKLACMVLLLLLIKNFILISTVLNTSRVGNQLTSTCHYALLPFIKYMNIFWHKNEKQKVCTHNNLQLDMLFLFAYCKVFLKWKNMLWKEKQKFKVLKRITYFKKICNPKVLWITFPYFSKYF